MARYNTWRRAQIELLEKLRGDGAPWDEIARRCGHPNASCQTKLSEVRKARRASGSSEPAPPRGRPETPYIPAPVVALPPPAPATPPSARTCRITTLQADADLRARIEVLGPTGGLLGDPLPGRSALDRKREGMRG